jgi:hypothetical protein
MIAMLAKLLVHCYLFAIGIVPALGMDNSLSQNVCAAIRNDGTETINKSAIADFLSKDFESAKSKFEKALALTLKSKTASLEEGILRDGLGRTYEALGERTAAIYCLRKSLLLKLRHLGPTHHSTQSTAKFLKKILSPPVPPPNPEPDDRPQDPKGAGPLNDRNPRNSVARHSLRKVFVPYRLQEAINETPKFKQIETFNPLDYSQVPDGKERTVIPTEQPYLEEIAALERKYLTSNLSKTSILLETSEDWLFETDLSKEETIKWSLGNRISITRSSRGLPYLFLTNMENSSRCEAILVGKKD